MQLSGHYFRPHLHILNFLQNFLISFGADESNLGIQGCQITIIISFCYELKAICPSILMIFSSTQF